MADNIFTISLEDVKIFARHGVFTQERTAGNEFVVNLSVSYILSDDSVIDDDLNATISYAELYDVIKEEMAITSFLLETVAYRVKRSLLAKWPDIIKGEIAIAKLGAPIPGFNGKAAVKLLF